MELQQKLEIKSFLLLNLEIDNYSVSNSKMDKVFILYLEIEVPIVAKFRNETVIYC